MSISVEHTWQEISLKASLQPLRDSFLFFVTDQEQFGIGSIVAGVPPVNQTLLPNPSAIALLGEKNLNLSRIIIRNLSKKLQKPVVGFIDIKADLPSAKLGKFIIELLDLLYEELENSNGV